MKTGNQMNDAEASAAIPIDPFAVDFFGNVNSAPEDDEIAESFSPISHPRKRKPKSDWFRVLPKVTNRDAALSNAIAALPTKLSDELIKKLTATIGRFTFSDAVECEVISITEVDLNFAVNGLNSRPRVFLNVGCAAENCTGAIVLDVEFASVLVDSVLDGPGDDFAGRRGLSPIETTIVEFMAANVISATNAIAGDAILILEGVDTKNGPKFTDHERGAELVMSIRFGERNGIATVLLSGTILRNLARAGRDLLTDTRSTKNFSAAAAILPQIDTRLVAGFTTLDSSSLVFLEPDDVVMIENPLIDRLGAPVGAGPFALLGSGRGFKLRGSAEDNGFNGNLLFRIEEILSEEARRSFTPAKFKMDEKENDAPDAEITTDESDAETMVVADEQLSAALENIQVALRVEIAGKKISLRELQDLRAGQIIALGCGPNDPVRLVTDNNDDPVATGELIEIEGQLGVRLTRVFI